MIVGRFAPSPTGPLHMGSLVAALGSYIMAKRAGGRWLVRMEDLDTPRVVAGAAEGILETLRRYGLNWGAEVVYQSERSDLCEQGLQALRGNGFVSDCGGAREDWCRCRNGLPPGRVARSVRFRMPDGLIGFDDRLKGRIEM